MADTPVDTSTTEENTPRVEDATTPEAEQVADAPVEEQAPQKKKPAKKAAARRKPAKKAAPKPEPVVAEPVVAEPVAEEPAAEERVVPEVEEPAAPETEAEPTPVAEEAPAPESEDAAEEAEEAEEAGAPGTMLLFKAPEPVKAPARRKSKKAKPVVEAADEDEPEETDEEPAAELIEPEPTSGDADEAEETDEESEGGTGGRRRRRRGGRRRRKPAGGGGAADANGEDTDEESTESADDAAEDDRADAAEGETGEPGEGGATPSSRRRRRRRREGEAGEGGNDTPNTVTKVRKPRSAEDEITAVSGSTRLEAKKQRRREGREAGRRRAPIISEAEFLARRESVDRVMVVRQRNDLTQIAVLEDKVLVEHYVARESQTSLIGNVYLGRVQNVLPSMEAAFIDIGRGRNAVLYAGEVNWSALGHKEGTPRKIESVLQSGQTVLVQVTKDPIGHKGARLTSQISLAGRFLVYVPDGTTSGISRKLPDTERGRLKTLLKEIVPESAGVIVRTAAEGASEDELTRDVERLKARWEDIEAKAAKGSNAPQLLYGEPDLTLKVVRDLFTEDFSKLVVQGKDAWETVHGYVEHVAPDLAERLEHYETDADGAESRPDVFAAYRIDEQIAKGLDRKVWLPSGGSLIIDRTEAMTVIDVNTGKFTGSGGNLEETVTKNNLEAAEEIVRQLRLRDIGGIIVVDFIDMVLESNRDLVLRRLVECLGRDRTRHQVAEVTSLGLVQMTRKRIGTGLLEAFSETCDHCQGRGVIVHDLPVEPRRGGGDEESRRGSGRRRRGKGGGQPDDTAPKAVPSPKDVAAMAKPPAEPEADETPAAEVEETAPAVEETVAAEVEETVAAEVEEAPVPEAEPVPEEAPEPVVDKPVTKVVTRTRRRAASRPAGPPVAAEEPPATPDAAADGQPELPIGDEQPVVGDIGAPADNGVVEPNVGSVEPSGDGEPEEPHVEHVPVKKKGTRKR